MIQIFFKKLIYYRYKYYNHFTSDLKTIDNLNNFEILTEKAETDELIEETSYNH